MSDEFVYTASDDPRAAPLVAQLSADYERLYAAEYGEGATGEMTRYPPERFAPPTGAFLLLLRNGVAIAGGAFKSYGPSTAEMKRIWVDEAHRRQGLARKILIELEAQAARQGYARIYLTTGFRQAPATALYLAAGYTPLFDPRNPGKLVLFPFEKKLRPAPGKRAGRAKT